MSDFRPGSSNVAVTALAFCDYFMSILEEGSHLVNGLNVTSQVYSYLGRSESRC